MTSRGAARQDMHVIESRSPHGSADVDELDHVEHVRHPDAIEVGSLTSSDWRCGVGRPLRGRSMCSHPGMVNCDTCAP